MRVVLDTNVIVSAFLSPHGAPARLFQQYQRDVFALVVSEPILTEYQQALNYPKVQRHHQMDKEEVASVIEELRRAAVFVTPHNPVNPALADRDDVKFFACAVAGDAEYIVSGDRLVQDVGTYQGIQVLSPSLFLTVLEEGI